MKNDAFISSYSWPLTRLGEGLEVLGRRAGLAGSTSEALAIPASVALGQADDFGRWIEWAGARLGMEAEAVATSVSGCRALVRSAGPALFTFLGAAGPCFVLVQRSRFGSLHLIGPDLKTRRCPAEALRAAICARYEAPLTQEIDDLLARAQVPSRRWQQVRSAMLAERLATQAIGACWILRLPASTPFWRQLTHAGLPYRLGLILGLFVLVYGFEILGWSLIGNAALNGRLDLGWLSAWLLLVLSMVPLRLAGSWLDATFALDGGRLLRSRLLAGALKLDPGLLKHQGAGQLLGRVMESQALESLAINGGMALLVALIELGFSAWILASGAGGQFHLLLLAGWLALTGVLSWRYCRRMRNWTLMRLGMTHDLVERMLGHRTRLAQEWQERRDGQEDQATGDYLQTSRRMDQAMAPVATLVPGGWMLIGLIGLAPAFIGGSANAIKLAIGLGGVLLANRAFSGISSGLAGLARAAIAWKQVAPMFHAAAEQQAAGPFLTGARIAGTSTDGAQAKLIDATGLAFRYRAGGEAVLRGVDLAIHRNERILLEGPSGSGKSTLAALLVGLQKPDAGLLLLHGLDRHTLGDGWHQLATEAPQFHENHILTGTIGFNLLMGRNWPATETELQEAKEVCIELGLGDLLERMPSGMRQMVGETGWQLSHGERSRIFLARALLQNAQLTVLDESFAALDPETLARCLDCAFRRAGGLVVIAHP
jgi:ATP-binding cassette, subfamily B, bacterial